ncbi:ion channel [Aspergillus crustosus]
MRPPDDDEPQDWWIASTAIPLIAATTGPLANLMSIIALVIPWRNNIHWDQMGVEGTPVQVGYLDPRWCIALNATSLACGLVGNIFLLCNFTRMVRYIVALPVSIFLWLLSTAILIGLTVSMYIYESPTPPNQTFSQAYWSAVISAVLYFLLSIMLMINMLGYFLGHYPQNFILTDDQRTLILQTIGFITWLAIGGAIFTQAIEGISYADAVYFSDVTILTLGFGDITSSEPVGRGIILPYAVIGMVMLGLVVSSIHRFAQEIQEDNVVMNHIQRKRKKVVQRSTSESISNSSSELDIEYHQRHSRRKPIIATINPFTLARESRRSRAVIMKEEKDRFAAMRAIQNETARYRRWTSLWISILAFAIVWTCGAVVFWALEDNMSYFNALYFGFCCLLTIGYGDFTPTTNASRPFFIVWSLIAVPTMTTLISKMSDTLVRGYKRATGFVATWTFFPQSGQYRAVLGKYPRIGKEVRRESASPELEKGKEVHQESSQSPALESQGTGGLSLESLAQTPTPTNQQLAQHLAHAIQTTIKDSMADEPKKYTYEEWVAFTRLIRFTDPNRTSGGDVLEEDEYGVLSWDWIGERSPLVAEKTEPEWVLDRLCESLVRYVSMQGSLDLKEGLGKRNSRDGGRKGSFGSIELA